MELKDFENTKIAFAAKSDSELYKSYVLFRLINNQLLTKTGTFLVLFAAKARLPVKWMIRATMFEHFCGGETLAKSEKNISKLANANIGVILDYAVEGEQNEAGFAETERQIFAAIDRAATTKYPFVAIKITGLASSDILECLTMERKLTASQEQQWQQAQQRVDRICKEAAAKNVPLLIDAEESWIQDAIDQITYAMMRRYNSQKPIVYNTFQLYRQDRLAFLKKSHQLARQHGYILGAKLVRGAYLEKERHRAMLHKYPSPIHISKKNTDHDFDAALDYCVENIDTISLFMGTHNENSTIHLTKLLEQNNLEKNHKYVYFAQLFGMGEHISYNLANAGYNVLKVLPYGPVMDAVPYLLRRAEENTSIVGQMGRELKLIIEERRRRKREKQR